MKSAAQHQATISSRQDKAQVPTRHAQSVNEAVLKALCTWRLLQVFLSQRSIDLLPMNEERCIYSCNDVTRKMLLN